MKHGLIYIFLFLLHPVYAQINRPDSVQILNNSTSFLSLKSPFSVFQITNRNERPQKNKWKPTADSLAYTTQQSIWIYYQVYNPDNLPRTYFFNGKNIDLYDLIFLTKSNIKNIQNGGYQYNNRFSINQYMQIDRFEIPAHDTARVFLKINAYQALLDVNQKKVLKLQTLFTGGAESLNGSLERYWQTNIYELQVRSMVQGALFLIVLLSIFFMVVNRKDDLFRYYFFYTFIAFLFSLLSSRNYTYAGQFFQRLPMIRNFGGELCLWLGFAAYFRFVPLILSLHKTHLQLYGFAKKVSMISAVLGLSIFLYMVSSNDVRYYKNFLIFSRIPLIVIYLYFLYRIKNEVKSTMLKYVLVANYVLLALGLTAWIKKIAFESQPWPGLFNQIFTLPAAVLAEVMVFSLGLVNKINEDQKEKILLSQKLVETELQALRSQMNPHFLYNCINSIKYYVIKNEPAQASLYLNKFAKLIRKFLSNSQQEFISLESEIETLSLYLEMENLRFGDKMKFNFEVDSNLEIGFIRMPAMLIQPYLENAIWHGILHKLNGVGILSISIIEKNEFLEIRIEDNGIGRQKARELKSKTILKNKSRGMEMTQSRIQHLNSMHHSEISLEIIDLTAPDGQAMGTRVCIRMKIFPFHE